MIMVDNKHFLQFMNRMGITTIQLAAALDVSYRIARLRVETLKFTAHEICQLSEYTTIPVLDIISIITGKAELRELKIPYANTKEMAIEKLSQDDDFIRFFMSAGHSKRGFTQSEINNMKKHLKK